MTDPSSGKAGNGASDIAGLIAVAQERMRAKRAAVDMNEVYKDLKGGELQRTLDADTMELSRGKLRQSTRLDGIDAPESAQSLGPAAHAFLDQMVKDHGKIRVGSRKKDKHGRDVSILYAGDKNLNVELVRAGHAKVYHRYLDGLSKEMRSQLVEAEDEAKKFAKGVWDPRNQYEDPEAYRRRVGRTRMAEGHDNRPPKDPLTMTMAEAIRRVEEKRGAPLLLSGSKSRTEGAGNPRPYIDRASQYQKEEGWLDRTVNALDYLGNASRSVLRGAIEGDSAADRLDKAVQFGGEALRKERRTSATQLKDTVTEAMGYQGKLRFGIDNNDKLEVGDIADFGIDLVTDIVTDPVTWMTAGVSSIAKGGKLAKAAPALHKGAAEAKLGSTAGDAAKWIAMKKGLGAGLGAAYGVGASDHDDGFAKPALGALVGGIVGWHAPAAMDKVGKTTRRLFDKATDSYAAWTRGSKFKDMSIARAMQENADKKIQDVALWIQQGRQKALEGLSDAERLTVAGLMKDMKTETLRRRALAEKSIVGKAGEPDFDRAFNAMMKKINFDVERSYAPALLKGQSDKVKTAVEDWAKHNDEVMRQMNQIQFGTGVADSAKMNKGVRFETGSYIRDPDTGKLKRSKDFYAGKDVDYLKRMFAQGDELERLDFGRFAKNDITLKDGSVIKAGTKLSAWDFKQLDGAGKRTKYDKFVLQDGTALTEKDILIRAKDFQPYNPSTFDGGRGVVGLRYHIDDIYKRKDIVEKTEDAVQAFGVKKAESLYRSKAAVEIADDLFQKKWGRAFDRAAASSDDVMEYEGILSRVQDKTYQIYANDFAKNFLKENERSARTLVGEYLTTAAKQKGVRAVETVLHGFDRVTGFMKANMLMLSTSWLKNNYWDNLGKSFIENGTQGLFDAATMGAYRKGVFQDVKALYGGNSRHVFKAPEMMEAVEDGVLDNPLFKSLSDTSTRRFMFTPDQIAEHEAKMGPLSKLSERIINNPYSRMVASIGSHMEGTARMMTYLRTKEALLKTPALKAAGPKELLAARRMAADVVKRTFFDYDNVTQLEKAVFARMVPFYSFYSKNVPYWMKAMIDPEKAGRVLALEKARRNVGQDPTSYEKKGMTPYLLENGARSLGTDEAGRSVYGIMPSGSMYDALRMTNPLGVGDELKDKGHPIPKAIYELISGNDLFDGQKLYPSDSEKGKKFLFSRGFKHKILQMPGVEVDKNGNVYTTSDATVAIDKIVSTIFPHGIVDQVAGSVGKVVTGKETPLEALSNRLSPMQFVKVSEAYARMVRKRKEEERGKEDR